MKKLIYFSLALALLAGCGTSATKDNDPWGKVDPSQGTKESIVSDLSMRSNSMGRNMTYSVYLPADYDKTKTYPFFYLLHGYEDSDQKSTHNRCWLDKGNARKIADDYIRNGGVSMVIIMPNGLDKFYYKDGYEKYFEEELMPKVEADFHCNGKRAIGGLSMGGFGTIYHAVSYPEKFTYAYPMSPAANYVEYDYTTWSVKEAIYNIDIVKSKPAGTKFPPFTFEVGNQDMTVNNGDTKKLYQEMVKLGLDCTYVERDGSHDWVFWKACLPKALQKVGASFK